MSQHLFSKRLSWEQAPNELTRRLAAKRAAGRNVLDLTQSNPTTAGIHYPAAEIAAALADPRLATYEPAPRGLAEARGAVAAAAGRADPADVLLTASTSEAYGYLFKLLCDPGDVVLAPRPSYPLFEYLTALEGVTLAPYPLAYDGVWHLDFPALEAALDAAPRARAILLVNPNNPTGSYLKSDEATRLLELASRRRLAVISDEVFADYPATDAPGDRCAFLATPDAPALVFGLGGLSKGAGLPQLKLGWFVVGGPPASRAAALERLELIADCYLSAATPVMLAAPRLLALGATIRAEIRTRVHENRAWLALRLPRGSAVELLPAEGGWYATLRFPRIRSDEELALAALEQHDTYVHPGYFFDLPLESCLVVSLLPPPTIFRPGIDAILRG